MSRFECIRISNRHDFAQSSMYEEEEDLPEGVDPDNVRIFLDLFDTNVPCAPVEEQEIFERWTYGTFTAPYNVSKFTRWVAKRDNARFGRLMVALHKDLGAELRPGITAPLSLEQIHLYGRVCDKVLELIDIDEDDFFDPNFGIISALVASAEYDESQIMTSLERASKMRGMRTFRGFLLRTLEKIL